MVLQFESHCQWNIDLFNATLVTNTISGINIDLIWARFSTSLTWYQPIYITETVKWEKQRTFSHLWDKCKGVQPIQDQSSVLGADILNNPRNNYTYGRSSNYPQRIQLSPKHQLGELQCSWEVKLCNSIILVVHVCKQWPIKRQVSCWKTAPTNTPVSPFW